MVYSVVPSVGTFSCIMCALRNPWAPIPRDSLHVSRTLISVFESISALDKSWKVDDINWILEKEEFSSPCLVPSLYCSVSKLKLDISTLPWDRRCLDLQSPIISSGHNSFSSVLMLAVNSQLSLCKICWAPITKNTFCSKLSTDFRDDFNIFFYNSLYEYVIKAVIRIRKSKNRQHNDQKIPKR